MRAEGMYNLSKSEKLNLQHFLQWKTLPEKTK